MCQQGTFTPIGNPEVKEPAVPSQSQLVLKSVYTNRERAVYFYTSKNAQTPTDSPKEVGGDCGSKPRGVVIGSALELETAWEIV